VKLHRAGANERTAAEYCPGENPGGGGGDKGPHGAGAVPIPQGTGPRALLRSDTPGRGGGGTILPPGFALSPGLPGYLRPDWSPSAGYSPAILESAEQFTRTAAQASELARLEGFLYAYILGRVPRASLRALNWNTWQRIRELKLEAGHWQEIAPPARFPGPGGKPDGLAAVYALSPEYLREIALEASERGNYLSLAALRNRKKLKPPPPEILEAGLPPALGKGTGLIVRFPVLVMMLCNPGAFRGLPGALEASELEIWEKALRAWRILSRALPGAELMPGWSLSKETGWIYSRRPQLQALPKLARLEALESIDGAELGEADYGSCQPNIARAKGGKLPRVDAYAEIVETLKARGLEIDRETAKALTLPILHGRNLGQYLHLYREGKVSASPAVFEALRQCFTAHGFPLMQAQGRIMYGALERLGEKTERTGLPVFDSILTPEPDLAAAMMTEASLEELGTALPVTVSRAGQLALELEA